MTTIKTPVTASNALFCFYDLESLSNVFSNAMFTPRTNTVDLFFMLEPGSAIAAAVEAMGVDALMALIVKGLFAANPAFMATAALARTVNLYNLATQRGTDKMAKLIGLFQGDAVNDLKSTDVFGDRFRPVCDTSRIYDPINKHAYLAGYNSYAYDTSMLALYFHEAYSATGEFIQVPPSLMRRHNDELFSDRHREYMPSYLTEGAASGGQGWNSKPSLIRKAMLDSGRHLDVSRLNETQKMVGLKRMLGNLGRQILESDKLSGPDQSIETIEELCELLAYNVSDVVGLAKLFEHPAYSSSFDLKKGLLDEYPEVVYEAQKGTSEPDVRPFRVRMGRLTPDSTSAKFVARILAPYKSLEDIPAVSFLYPSERVAKETGRERRNVLADAIAFFKASVDATTEPGKIAHAAFDEAMAYYQAIEGKNFNDSLSGPSWMLSEIPRTANNLPYFNTDGSPSPCFVTFSTGGIHGAEYDEEAYADACRAAVEFNERLAEIKEQWPEPLDFWLAHPGKKVYTASDGVEVSRAQALTAATALKLLKAEIEAREALKELTGQALVDAENSLLEQYSKIGYRPDKPLPALFEKATNGSTKLKPAFTYTSAARAIHEDFTSYYPNMLRMMSAFYNPDLGTDRYAKIFEDKERYGREMKAKGISADEKARLGVLRNGTKLILNSASGAGDVTRPNPIRMNNQIISMRIIGQLFSWRIGQAQTLAGAKVVSTNTDGLYSTGLDDATNNQVLAREAALIGVDIEPEPLLLVSKDSNNRLELKVPKDGKPIHEAEIVSASGGTLACHREPQPTKSLAHPAVLDWALARYLREILGDRTSGGRRLSLDEPMNRQVARWLMEQARDQEDTLLAARLFQNVLAASAGMITFPFATDVVTSWHRALQHYNRVYVVRPGTPGAVHIQAAGSWVVNAASKVKRANDGEQPVVRNDRVALDILRANGWTPDGSGGTKILPADQDAAVRRVPRIDPAWHMLVDNRDLVELDPQLLRTQILDRLDLDAYVQMLVEVFEKNWANRLEVREGAEEGDTAEQTEPSSQELDRVAA